MSFCNLKFGYNNYKGSVKSTTLQNCTGNKKHIKQKHTKTEWNIKCAWQSVLIPNRTLARCVFFTNSVKVGAVWLTHCYIVIRVVGIIIDYVFIKTLLELKKKGYKNWGPKILDFLSLQ